VNEVKEVVSRKDYELYIGIWFSFGGSRCTAKFDFEPRLEVASCVSQVV